MANHAGDGDGSGGGEIGHAIFLRVPKTIGDVRTLNWICCATIAHDSKL